MTRADQAEELAKQLEIAGVPVVRQGDSDYAREIAKNFQTRANAQFKPAVFAKPRSIEEVSAAVKVGARLGVKVAARSGGHSSCNISLGGTDGHLVIDMAHFNQVEVNAKAQTAILGSGGRLGPVHLELSKSNAGLSTGVCPAVGVGGHLSHGGAQLCHRTRGLALDAIFAYDAVLADGSIVHVTHESHPDLFWALKGFASSYAIVTRFHVTTWQVPPRNVHFEYIWHVDASTAAQVWKQFQVWARGPDCVAEFGRVGIDYDRPEHVDKQKRIELRLEGNFLGETADFERHFAAFLAGAPKPTGSHVHGDLKWIEMIDKVKVAVTDEDGGLSLSNYHTRLTNFERSVLLADDLPAAAIEEYLRFVAEYDWTTTPYALRPAIMIDLIGGNDSFVNKVSPEESSFPRRKELTWLIWVFFTHWGPEPEQHPIELFKEHQAFVDHLHAILLKHLGKADIGTYANAPEILVEDANLRYFGENGPRLAELKQHFDPQDVLSTPLTVKPAPRSHKL